MTLREVRRFHVECGIIHYQKYNGQTESFVADEISNVGYLQDTVEFIREGGPVKI
jgi:hypothetical protein